MGAMDYILYGLVLSICAVWCGERLADNNMVPGYIMRQDAAVASTGLRFEPYQQIWTMKAPGTPVVCGKAQNDTYICDIATNVHTGVVRAYGMHEKTDDAVSIHCAWVGDTLVSDSCVLRVHHPHDTFFGNLIFGIVILVGTAVSWFILFFVLVAAMYAIRSLCSQNEKPITPSTPVRSKDVAPPTPEDASNPKAVESKNAPIMINVFDMSSRQCIQVPLDSIPLDFLSTQKEHTIRIVMKVRDAVFFKSTFSIEKYDKKAVYGPSELRNMVHAHKDYISKNKN